MARGMVVLVIVLRAGWPCVLDTGLLPAVRAGGRGAPASPQQRR
jgi:hypothetical protein